MSVLGQALGQQKPKKRNFFYPTIDPRCVPPLLEHVPPGSVFAEPCAGAGDLVHLLEAAGLVCAWGLELEPQSECLRNRWPIAVGNALQLDTHDLHGVDLFISNLPWERDWLEPLIWHLASIAPLWSLHDAGWCYTARAAPFRSICTDVVAVGRLKWFEPRGRPLRKPLEDYATFRERAARHMKPSDPPTDCAWYRFDARPEREKAPTRFHFRAEAPKDDRQGVLI